ncbi:lysophospholipid acyltransferase family protein [Aurantibacillus circumpalustris]|uniref:lysophospholipid acyltransferase family protein n=1 Tax=Aurantibacillus circumpalustris TaxID=3036359 RepID=UPI00295B1FE3|nr:lysophospholipid acyltransferase family protein [Aurantibacillus circumpalustris]
MSKWLFKIFVIPLLYFISILPFWLLLGISHFFYLIVYYLIGYRKKVVIENLKNSFPEKSEKEIKKITKDFYLHFCDVIFETVKLLTISKKEFKKRCAMDEASIKSFHYFFNKNQTFVGVMGHCGNWEWGAIAHQVYFERMITGVYHPLSNKNFDKFMLNLRGRFGGDIVAMSQLYKRLITLKQQNISTTIGLIADQTPPPESAYWTNFLNQDTPVFNGTEKLAKKFNYPVVYLNIKKVKRGYYDLSTTIITENPQDHPVGEITELHTKHLEKNIREQPYTWLWSHRRWKHKRSVKP